MPALRHLTGALFATALAAGALSACGAEPASDSTGESASAGAGSCALTVTDQWVKAAESGMTAAFATISNPGSVDEVVTSASSPAAGRSEIHEVVDRDGSMVMQPKEGGLPVAAGGSASLVPGGDHLMLLDLTAPIEPGDEVELTIGCRSGGSMSFTAVAKPFEGGAEQYEPGGMSSMSPSPAEG